MKHFAQQVAKHYYGFHLLALDICLNEENLPVLIETNVEAFSFWIPMLFGYDVFNGEIEKVISYCSARKNLK